MERHNNFISLFVLSLDQTYSTRFLKRKISDGGELVLYQFWRKIFDACGYFTFLEGQTASAAPICYWVKTIRQIFKLSFGIFQVCKTLASEKKNSTISEDFAKTQETIFNPGYII